MELNPNHPMTSTMHGHWHKIAMLLVARLPGKQTVITLDEVVAVGDGQQAITIKESAAGIELRVVSMEEGRRLARQEGGLPV